MSKLLIDEHPLLVLPSLAVKIGLAEALFLQQLHYWLETNGHQKPDGRRWIHNTYEEWSVQFPWWNIGTIRRLVNTLRDAGLIITSRDWNRMAIDNTLWYTIDYPQLAALDADPEPAPPDPEPGPDEPTDPPIPADPPIPPSAETDTSSAETDRPRAQNAQTTRAKCTDHARILRTPITRDFPAETPTETPPDKVVVEVHPHSQPHRISRKKRAHARARDPQPPTPLPTYDAANTSPAAVDRALVEAGIFSPETRTSITNATPSLTVADILAWDTQRTRDNAGKSPGRQMGAGALAAILRTGQRPPARAYDPEHVERWLITAGYLVAPEPSDPPPPATRHSPPATPLPQPDPAAAALWQQILTAVQLTLDRSIYHNHLAPTTAIALDHTALTIHVPTRFSLEWLEARLKGTLLRHLHYIHPADPPLHLRFQLPP